MAQISGKYLLTNVAEFEKYLKQEGVPEDKVKESTTGDHFLEIKVDGQKLSINEHHGKNDFVSDLVLGKEVEEDKPWGKFKTTAKLDGNVLSLDSKTTEGKTHIKTYTFSGDQVELKRPSRKGGAGSTLIFKKA